MAPRKHLAVYHPAALACLAFCACGFGQQQFPPDHPPFPPDQLPVKRAQKQIAQPSPAQPSQPAAATAAAPPTAPAAAPSLLDHPAQPPTVNLASGKLTVRANNSSLSEILHDITQASGMKVEGLQKSGGDQRIFGIYGPGAPRDVLSQLLDGAGYNVLMLGVTSSGAPRELALTVRSTGTAAPTAQPQPGNINQNDDSEGDVEPAQYPDENQQNVAPPPGLPEGRRTPQQLLQELERQRQEQQNQQVDQQPN